MQFDGLASLTRRKRPEWQGKKNWTSEGAGDEYHINSDGLYRRVDSFLLLVDYSRADNSQDRVRTLGGFLFRLWATPNYRRTDAVDHVPD